MRVTLRVTEGPHQGREFAFAEHDTFIVGRSRQAHFRFSAADKYFSRHHFVVEVNPPHCRLMDLGSRNGTFVNGNRTAASDLRDGDTIRAGRTVLSASIEKSAGDDEAPATTAAAATDAGKYATIYPEPAADTRTPVQAGEATVTYTPGAAPVPGYRIVRELGQGGMGVVYSAIRTADGTSVALKTIKPQCAASPAHIARFLREASILRELDHPNIVAFRDMGEAGDCLYIAMDYVHGTDAAGLLKQCAGGMPVGRAVELVCQLLEALDYAHAKGFVHRDIKPANVLVAAVRDGKGATREMVKLADFGFARIYQSASFSGLTMQGDYGGTYAFMPPEQITAFREARPASDLYSAGATLYNLLTGKFVYDLPTAIAQRVLMLLQEEPVPIQSRRPNLPPALSAAIHRALARAPADRFPDARAMQQALAPFRAMP